MSMSSRAAPAGIIGNTLSNLVHSAWTRTGPSLYSKACLTMRSTSAGRLMLMPLIPYAAASFMKSGLPSRSTPEVRFS